MDIRARLRVKIAEQDRRRGRSLTDRERLANLRVALDRPLTIEECEAEMAAAGIVPTPAPMPFEPQPEN
jgi:hypothetical protein